MEVTDSGGDDEGDEESNAMWLSSFPLTKSS